MRRSGRCEREVCRYGGVLRSRLAQPRHPPLPQRKNEPSAKDKLLPYRELWEQRQLQRASGGAEGSGTAPHHSGLSVHTALNMRFAAWAWSAVAAPRRRARPCGGPLECLWLRKACGGTRPGRGLPPWLPRPARPDPNQAWQPRRSLATNPSHQP